MANDTASKNRNLIVRVVSALVLLPVVLWLTWLGGWPFAALIAAAAAICALEMTEITLSGVPLSLKVVVIVMAGALPLLVLLPPSPLFVVLLPGVLVVLWILHLLAPGTDLTPVPGRVALALTAIVYTGGLLVPAVLLRERPDGLWWVVLLMAVTWLNDTGAYFSGRLLGRRKLYPRVSPNKTWEGLYGGVLASVGGAFAVQFLSGALPLAGTAPLTLPLGSLLLLGLVTGLLGPLGDLSESLLKRAYAVKDSGRILPGHGGLLDRVDALLFNAAAVYLWAVLS